MSTFQQRMSAVDFISEQYKRIISWQILWDWFSFLIWHIPNYNVWFACKYSYHTSFFPSLDSVWRFKKIIKRNNEYLVSTLSTSLMLEWKALSVIVELLSVAFDLSTLSPGRYTSLSAMCKSGDNHAGTTQNRNLK